MKRVAVYCRLSDEDRNKKNRTDESESIQNQKSLLLEYCRMQNWTVYDVYCDEDMSGADNTRPEFNRMLKDCKDGAIDIVLCKTQSRFSRDIEVVEHYIHNKFRDWGVRFIGLLDHADTEDFANKKSRQINGLVNEWYLEDLSENIKKTLRHKKENGIFTGAFAPFGYKLDAEQKGKLFIDAPAAEIVRQIFKMYLSGNGYVKIAKELNRMGCPCPSEYKRLCGSKFKTHSGERTSNIWTESVIRQILKNPVYIGTLVQGKTSTISYKNRKRKRTPIEEQIVTENAHEAIIERSDWEKVNNKIGTHVRTQKNDGKRHIFAGKIFCAECKNSMWKMSYQLKDGRYEYLKCKTTKCGEGICNNSQSIRLEIIKELVTEEVKKLLKDHFCAELVHKDSILSTKKGPDFCEETFIQEKILKQNLNIKQLYKDKLDGIIELEIFSELYKDINKEIFNLKKRLLEIRENKSKTQKCNIQEYIDNFTDKIDLDEYVVSLFIRRIYIGAPMENKREITIEWNV